MIDDLPAPFQMALETIVDELATAGDLIGILFFGSAARGEARPGSDLDLYAITSQDARRHLGRSIVGVPVEVSFGSIAQMTAQVREEVPTVVHAFASGHLLLDHSDGALLALCHEARSMWERGPSSPAAAALLRFQFHLTNLARDLEVMPERSAATSLVGSECVTPPLDDALCFTHSGRVRAAQESCVVSHIE
ncbi:MAG: nucleotidyltransferase domain-containing protein [Gemmatimonadota bacterium]|nr:nucleotidyltransferase domain-containing protein [Gemmatimonadota bacterium]